MPGIKKYDVNSLFASTEKDLPDLGQFKNSNFNEYKADMTGKHEYIFIINSLILKRKKDMPGVFNSPFELYENNEDYIEISQEWAVFAPFLEILKQFYDIIEMDITSVYKAVKYQDFAIVKYVNNLDKLKRAARRQNNKGLASIVKFFIVNLHGKFAQKTVSEDVRFLYDVEHDIVVKQDSEELKEEWKAKHFDYIRGAYIYTMARVRIMQIILKFKEVLPAGNELVEHIFYDDTDSIVTDLTAPADIVHQYELGKLKLEEEYITFEVIAPKTYYGRTKDGNIKLVCAGIDKECVFKGIREAENIKDINLLSDAELHKIFTDETRQYKMPILTRIKGGNGYKEISRALTSTEKINYL